jgi:hypothetical protein
MLPTGRAGVAVIEAMAGFALPSQPVIGNPNPAWTGSPSTGYPAGPKDAPGPHPAGQPMGGQTGDSDPFFGADPTRPKMSPFPASPLSGASGEGDPGSAPGPSAPPTGYGWDAPRPTDGAPSRLGPLGGDPLARARPSFRRFGVQGFNDQLQLRDRHAYYKSGYQRFGATPSVPGTPPNPHSDGPAMPYLWTVNRSVNPQIGSDSTRNQDDLTRPYTWLGQQDGTLSPVYGGVPGLHQSYGNRGFAGGIHDPSNGEGGLEQIYPGPPHGLHSDTIPDGKQLVDRYKATPQMRPVRQDRPDNSRIAGQSFSQTVVPQGATGAQGMAQRGSGVSFRVAGRGWIGG